MAGRFRKFLAHAWNTFVAADSHELPMSSQNLGPSYGTSPSRQRLRFTSERSIIGSIYTRLGIDVSAIEVRHVKVDGNGTYVSDIPSGLNNCLTVEANIDQAARAFRQDVVLTLFEHGTAAIVAVDTTLNPLASGAYDVSTLRVGHILQWFPQHVQVRVYNDQKGFREDIILPKKVVAIVENPLYSVMNEPNSTLQRLIRTLNLLDTVDENASSGKLDLIIQLPYVIKSEARQQQAEKRSKDVEFQLKDSKYGIAYIDGTEKITQLNRPATSNLLDKVTYLTNMLYDQLGLSESVFNGTATPAQMLLYNTRTIEPILTAITEAIKRAFLTKTARAQGQSVIFIQNPFKLIPIDQLADLIDVLSRNQIASANDIRGVVGWKPSKDPEANQLSNKNMPNDKRASLPATSSLVPFSPQSGALSQGAQHNGTRF